MHDSRPTGRSEADDAPGGAHAHFDALQACVDVLIEHGIAAAREHFRSLGRCARRDIDSTVDVAERKSARPAPATPPAA